MTGDERPDLFNELMRLLPRISIEQPAFMDSLETLSRLLEAAGCCRFGWALPRGWRGRPAWT